MTTSEDPLAVDLRAAGMVGGLARALLRGEGRDLVAPLRFLEPGALPDGTPPAVERGELAGGLAVANAAYGHPRAHELAAKLADPATRVIATGQQTGVLGGPLLGFVKAAAAVRYAEALEARGEPAVAIFWMATEDHDWDEVARASFLGRDGIARLRLGDDPQPLAPVGLRTVGAGIVPLLAELRTLYPTPWSAAGLARLAALWRPDARFGEAFARQMVDTFGARAPLMVDALLPELKRAERPHLARLVEHRAELDARFACRESRLQERGFVLQVAPQPGASPLFLLRGGLESRQPARRRIEWRGDAGYALRGAKGEAAVTELLATIADNPAVVSPGALARPAIQDAVFGTHLQVMGPGELGYLAQAAAVYEVLGIAAPWTSLRPSALVLPAKERRRLATLELPLAALLADPVAAEERLGARHGAGFVAPIATEIERRVAELGPPARELDPDLERPHAKTLGTIRRALERFAGKAARAALRRDEATRRSFDALVAACLPAGKPQERVLAAAHFTLRYGDGFGAALLEAVGLDPRRLWLVDPEDSA
jgi:bacillithiol biosynthesis cysteine-adding enzyme BshC